MPSPLALRAVELAVLELDHGEDPALRNNEGADLDRYRAVIPGHPEGAWCAALISYVFKLASAQLSIGLPFELSAGARRLALNMGRAGRFLELPEVGSVICRRRPGTVLLWQRHAQLVESVTFGNGGLVVGVIEGNVGPFPARVRRHVYSPGKWRDGVDLVAAV